METIIVDTLGGDNPPVEIIQGGIKAAQSYNVKIVFSGDRRLIERQLEGVDGNFSIIHASQAITMDDSPVEAVRHKRESSLVLGVEALREGKADAFVSPANTGAIMAVSLLKLGRIFGIDRPGIATALPALTGRAVLIIDIGANVNCTPQNLKQFAVMGTVYCREILGVKNPKVGLLNIGAERGKGNKLAQGAFSLLEKLENFYGNIESHRILWGDVDVVVCDGFVGNVLLKALEGGSLATLDLLHKTIQRSFWGKIGSFLLRSSLRGFKQKISSSNWGGAPLLGVRDIVIIAHGNSDARAIKNAIGVALSSIKHGLVEKIERGIKKEIP
jgi:glycerol-3-phosphate acyltransferase PlsX